MPKRGSQAEPLGAREVVMRRLAELTPYANNARTHSEEQVGMIADSIARFGFNAPVLTDAAGGIVAGHGRVLAAAALGLEEVPTIPLGHLSEAERRAYLLADNRIAEHSGWDHDLLKLELADLGDLEFDPDLLGFDPEFMANLLPVEPESAPAGSETEDDAPEPEETPITRPGDIWQLAPHRLGCGDSRDAELVAAVLAGAKPDLMVTDPPYGVEYDPNWRNEADRADGKALGARATGVVLNDDVADWREAWALFAGSVAYVWHASAFASEVEASLLATRFEIRSQIIWVKPRLVISRGHYHWRHEPCWYAVRKGATANWKGDRKQNTVWEIEHRRSATGHGTQKPVEAMRRPILHHTDEGDAVYDPFLGSGTTLIAAETTGRVCYGQELNPAYCDVIIRRWQEESGAEAILSGTTATFEDIAADRLAEAA